MTGDIPIKEVKLDWEDHYKTTPMKELHWYAEEIDPEVLAAIKEYCPACTKILDLGTGPGTVAIELTKLGYNVTATDISQSAIDMAADRAGTLAAKIKFLVDDIRNTAIDREFDLINDRGCFHVMSKPDITQYLKNVPQLLKAGGLLLLKTFSTKETEQQGPNRYDLDSIKTIFSNTFNILYHEETIYPSTLPVDPKAFFAVLRKV